jgi:type 1 glutamine amidotransferase
MKKLRAACLIGDYYHSSAAIEAALRPVLDSHDIDSEYFTEPKAFPRTGLCDYDLVVVAKEARAKPESSEERWSGEENEGALATFVEGGGKLFALHNGLASYDPDGTYTRLVRGRFLFHPHEHPRFQVRCPDGNAAFGGLKFFEIEDEMYFVHVDSAKTEVILETYSPDYGSSAAAWRHCAGAGRVFCFTPGHTTAVLENPIYRSILLRGVKWLMRE